MKREIEFRGFCPVMKTWYYGDFIHTIGRGVKECPDLILAHIVDGNNSYHLVYPDSIGQYTGLKDCEGVDTYEKDLCEYKYIVFKNSNRDPLKYSGEGKVIFERGCFWIKCLETNKTIPLYNGDLIYKITSNTFEESLKEGE